MSQHNLNVVGGILMTAGCIGIIGFIIIFAIAWHNDKRDGF